MFGTKFQEEEDKNKHTRLLKVSESHTKKKYLTKVEILRSCWIEKL